MSYKKNITKFKERIDKYIQSMLWARNPEHYAYMVGMISSYNAIVEGLLDQYTQMPDTPDAWIDTLNDQIKRQQDADKTKIIAPEKPKIILP